ncbi:hypothetical protein AB0J82_22435 [Asanoa sp. NPDC049518]
MVNLDSDAVGRLVGIEGLGASVKLAPEILAAADGITRQAPNAK